jgi:hypothetical protein
LVIPSFQSIHDFQELPAVIAQGKGEEGEIRPQRGKNNKDSVTGAVAVGLEALSS